MKLRLRRLVLALVATVMITSAAAAPSVAADCVSVNVKVLGQTVAVCIPVSDLPTVTVPGPRVTVNVPGPRTTVNVPGPVRTVSAPGPTVTRTKTTTVTQQQSPETRTVTKSSAGQTSTSRVTVTQQPSEGPQEKSPMAVREKTNTVTVTKVQAFTISLLAVAAGVLLTLFLIFLAYRYGWIRGDSRSREFFDGLRESLKNDRQH